MTGGAYDPFSWTGVAELGAPYAYQDGLYANLFAPFGDVAFINSYLSDGLQAYFSHAFADNLPFKPMVYPVTTNLLGAFVVTYGFNSSVPIRAPPRALYSNGGPVDTPGDALQGVRDYDSDSGVLTVRKLAGQRDGLVATFKLGGNSKPSCADVACQTHSHDDIGSYAMAVNGLILTGDIGGPRRYDVNDFSSTRYQANVFNSWGHPVPLVNGKVQMRADLLWNRMLTNATMQSSNLLARRLMQAARSKMSVAINKVQLPAGTSPNFVFDPANSYEAGLKVNSDQLPATFGGNDLVPQDVSSVRDSGKLKSLFYPADLKLSGPQAKAYIDTKFNGKKWRFEDFVKDSDYSNIVKGTINWSDPKFTPVAVSRVLCSIKC